MIWIQDLRLWLLAAPQLITPPIFLHQLPPEDTLQGTREGIILRHAGSWQAGDRTRKRVYPRLEATCRYGTYAAAAAQAEALAAVLDLPQEGVELVDGGTVLKASEATGLPQPLPGKDAGGCYRLITYFNLTLRRYA